MGADPWTASGRRQPKPMMHDPEKSDSSIVPVKPANKAGQPAAELAEGRDGIERNADTQSKGRAQNRGSLSQARDRIREAAARNRQEKLTTLLHHVTPEALEDAFRRLRKDAAPGVDGVTWEDYATDLTSNLEGLCERVHTGAYRAQPSRRKYIPKPDGRQRPLGIAALEDKIVQQAVVDLLTPIYEEEFLGFSYGFRPGRGQHDALDALAAGIEERRIHWILDADIQAFFDTISHDWLIRFVEHRIGDRRIIRLIRKWLKAGVLEDGCRIETLAGTPQGAVISPLLANIYLHYGFDLWVRQWRQRHAAGDMIVVRYADDTIVGFEHQSDAEKFLADLVERLAKFELNLHPDKTRLVEFGRWASRDRARRGQRKPETFDFLGFTHICGKARKTGRFQLRRQTKAKSMRSKIQEIRQTLRGHRQAPIHEQGTWLGMVIRGFNAYFAVPTNSAALTAFRDKITIAWMAMLTRRSQRHRLTWPRMKVLADRYLPRPHILHPWPNTRFRVRHSR